MKKKICSVVLSICVLFSSFFSSTISINANPIAVAEVAELLLGSLVVASGVKFASDSDLKAFSERTSQMLGLDALDSLEKLEDFGVKCVEANLVNAGRSVYHVSKKVLESIQGDFNRIFQKDSSKVVFSRVGFPSVYHCNWDFRRRSSILITDNANISTGFYGRGFTVTINGYTAELFQYETRKEMDQLAKLKGFDINTSENRRGYYKGYMHFETTTGGIKDEDFLISEKLFNGYTDSADTKDVLHEANYEKNTYNPKVLEHESSFSDGVDVVVPGNFRDLYNNDKDLFSPGSFGHDNSSVPGSGAGNPSVPGSGAGNPSVPGSGAGNPAIPGSGAGNPAIPGSGAGNPAIPGTGAGNPAIPGIGAGNPAIPDVGVDNPAIPGVGADSLPTTKTSALDWVTSLVVPSDTYFTSKISELGDVFKKAFPNISLDKFNSLCLNGKEFPSINLSVMGVNGLALDGKYVNSIVNWIRPLCSALVGICLIWYNYRQFYKLIRGVDLNGILPAPSSSKGD